MNRNMNEFYWIPLPFCAPPLFPFVVPPLFDEDGPPPPCPPPTNAIWWRDQRTRLSTPDHVLFINYTRLGAQHIEILHGNLSIPSQYRYFQSENWTEKEGYKRNCVECREGENVRRKRTRRWDRKGGKEGCKREAGRRKGRRSTQRRPSWFEGLTIRHFGAIEWQTERRNGIES